MLLSDYCSEINTRGIKKGKDKQYKLYQLNHGGQDCIRRGIFALADGRTERVLHDDDKFQNTFKRKSVLHNGGCVKEETNYHFNRVIRLGKLPFVLFAQIMFSFGPFYHIVGMGNGIIDL